MTVNDAWVRLHTGWAPQDNGRALGWAMWQLGYKANPWPCDELRPKFAYYVCEQLTATSRAIVAKATVTGSVRPTEVASAEDAYKLVADELFDDDLAIPPEDWHANGYNQFKAGTQWPKRLTAWRIVTEPAGPHVLPELEHFPRTGWLRTSRLAL